MRRRFTGLTAILLGITISFSGCGSEVREVPELIAPTAVQEFYRTVEYGTVGDAMYYEGSIVPAEHSFFWEKGVLLSEVPVEVGDYVEVGDVLAYADVEAAKEQLAAIRAERDLENKLFEIDEENYIYMHHQMEFDSTYAWENKQGKVVERIAKQIETLEENHRFDVMLHEYKLREFGKEMAACNKLVSEGVLRSDVAGYVTYRKDLYGDKYAAAGENIVVVSDYEELSIELNQTLEEYNTAYKNSGTSFVYLNGKPVAMTAKTYSSVELAVIDNRRQYPRMRFTVEDPSMLPPVGTNVIVAQSRHMVADVLRVDNGAIRSDDFGDFVYVMEDGKKERRDVVVGLRDSLFTEIRSGLKQGDKVCFTSTVTPPMDGKLVAAEKQSFSMTNETQLFTQAEVPVYNCYSDYSGQVVEFAVKDQEKVDKGALICKINTVVGSAKLTQSANELTNMEKQYAEMQKSFEEDRKALREAIEENEKMMNMELAALSAAQETEEALEEEEFEAEVATVKRQYGYLKRSLELSVDQIDCAERKEALTYEKTYGEAQAAYRKLKKNNDGKGTVSIYAQKDGVVNYDETLEGGIVNPGDRLYRITGQVKNIYWYKHMEDLLPGAAVTFTNEKSGEVIEGSVIGATGSSKIYVNAGEKETFLSESKDPRKDRYYYFRTEEPLDLSEGAPYLMEYEVFHLTDMVSVPAEAVMWELNSDVTAAMQIAPFVWLKVGDEYVKQYVKVADTRYYSRDSYIILEGLSEGDQVLANDSMENHGLLFRG